jgi:hypothetical protein
MNIKCFHIKKAKSQESQMSEDVMCGNKTGGTMKIIAKCLDKREENISVIPNF